MRCSKIVFIYIFILFLVLGCTALASPTKPILKRGMANEKVWELQRMLNDLGYKIDVDGRFGLQTEIIVKAFQSSFLLTGDGIVGGATWQLLEQVKPFISYTVKSGDTLSELSEKFETTALGIKLANNLVDDRIYVGQELAIPRSRMGGGEGANVEFKVIYEVSAGDTLSHLAKKFATDIDTIRKDNNLPDDKIISGQQLTIRHNSHVSADGFKKGRLIWPVIGRISSYYGNRIHPIYSTNQFHNGLDIAVSKGTPVRAAAAGFIITSGNLNGYGQTIIIDHGDGYTTLYGHNDTLLVKVGASVLAGQIIALSGNTGQSTGPHLHFEVREKNQTVDPILFLPAL